MSDSEANPRHNPSSDSDANSTPHRLSIITDTTTHQEQDMEADEVNSGAYDGFNHIVNAEYNSNDSDDTDYKPTDKEIDRANKAAEETETKYGLRADEPDQNHEQEKHHVMAAEESNSKPIKRKVSKIEVHANGDDEPDAKKARKISPTSKPMKPKLTSKRPPGAKKATKRGKRK